MSQSSTQCVEEFDNCGDVRTVVSGQALPFELISSRTIFSIKFARKVLIRQTNASLNVSEFLASEIDCS